MGKEPKFALCAQCVPYALRPLPSSVPSAIVMMPKLASGSVVPGTRLHMRRQCATIVGSRQP